MADSHDLEFKAASYGNVDGDRWEFLNDVTTMANTMGGHGPVHPVIVVLVSNSRCRADGPSSRCDVDHHTAFDRHRAADPPLPGDEPIIARYMLSRSPRPSCLGLGLHGPSRR